MYYNNFNYPYNMYRQIPHLNNQLYIPNINQGGLFSRFSNGIKHINWNNLLNNTSRTLGVINQAIPIVKQTAPMLNNMRSLMRVASAFKDETKSITKSNIIDNNNQTTKKEITSANTTDSLPNFFIS